MTKWVRNTIAAVVIIAAVVVVVWRASRRNPADVIYQRKPLSIWLRGFDNAPGAIPAKGRITQPEARIAVYHIGTNAIPMLMRMFQVKDSDLKFRLMSLVQKLPWIKIYPITVLNLNVEVREAFGVLGEIHEEPEIVVPALTKLLHDPGALARYIAIDDLGKFGAAGRAATADILELLKDRDPSICVLALLTLGRFYDLSEQDPQWDQLMQSTHRIGCQPSTLITVINDLGATGTNAELAVPAFTKLLNDPEVLVPASAAAAIRAIRLANAAKISAQ